MKGSLVCRLESSSVDSGGSQAGLSNLCSPSVLDGSGHRPHIMVAVLRWKEMKEKSVDYVCGRKGWVQGWVPEVCL